jgi:hypothetical protein
MARDFGCELGVEHPCGFAHQSAVHTGAGEHVVKHSAPFAKRLAALAKCLRTPAVS